MRGCAEEPDLDFGAAMSARTACIAASPERKRENELSKWAVVLSYRYSNEGLEAAIIP
jgi:hypothetical protein